MVTRSTTPWKPLRVSDGKLDGDAVAAPALCQVVNERVTAAAAAGLGVVHLIDHHDAGDVGFFGVFPNPLGDGLDAALGIDDDESGFNREQRGAGFVDEHVEAGGVDEVDFDALPFGEGNGILHGGAAGDFFFVVGGDGGCRHRRGPGWESFWRHAAERRSGWFCRCAHAPLQLRCGSHFPGRFSWNAP